MTSNNCLRRIWSLPAQTHTGILHCCAGLESLYNVVFLRSFNSIKRAVRSQNELVQAVFTESRSLAYCWDEHCLWKSKNDELCAEVLHEILSAGRFDVRSRKSETEKMLYTIAILPTANFYHSLPPTPTHSYFILHL